MTFCNFIGVARTNSRHEIELLESFVRTELNRTAQRRMAVLRPLELEITNWPTDASGEPVVEHVDIVNNPENADDGVRSVPFSGRLFIERDDFMAEPAAEVLPPVARQRGPAARCLSSSPRPTSTSTRDGDVTKVYATYDPDTRGGNAPDGRKVKSTMHWVSAAHARRRDRCAVRAAVRRARCRASGRATSFDDLAPDSRELLTGCKVEPALGRRRRRGRWCSSSGSATSPSTPTSRCLFHRTVGLRDEWANIQKRST